MINEIEIVTITFFVVTVCDNHDSEKEKHGNNKAELRVL